MSSQTMDLEVVSRLDGIEATDILTGKTQIIKHDDFRKWSFNQGYWTDAYYEFVEGLSPIVVLKYLNRKNNK